MPHTQPWFDAKRLSSVCIAEAKSRRQQIWRWWRSENRSDVMTDNTGNTEQRLLSTRNRTASPRTRIVSCSAEIVEKRWDMGVIKQNSSVRSWKWRNTLYMLIAWPTVVNSYIPCLEAIHYPPQNATSGVSWNRWTVSTGHQAHYHNTCT